MQGSQASFSSSERLIILLISAVQFVNVLEFMIVMPLGPDFAKALGIPLSQLGLVGGSYTAAAAISGLVNSFFIERFDRRKALACAMLGLVCATLAAGLARDLYTLLAARVLAGIFGGPAASLSLAIIADTIPVERRGRAMGAVMGSFAVASVLGVPAGLELARVGGWRLPFFAVSGLGILIAGLALLKLPSMRKHLELNGMAVPSSSVRALLRRPTVIATLAMTVILMISTFLLVPHIATYVQFNLHYPRERLGLLYLAGGIVSFILMRWIGRLVDRYGSFRVGSAGSALMMATIYIGFVGETPTFLVLPVFVAFMASASFRSVPYQTISSRVPQADERARFMSLQSAVQHLAAAGGGFLSSQMLHETPEGALAGMAQVAWLAIAMGAAMPFLFHYVQAQLAPKVVESSR